MALRWLIVVHNADVRAPGNHVHITEVHAVRDVGEEQEVWISSLVQDAEPVADMASVSDIGNALIAVDVAKYVLACLLHARSVY